MLAVERAVGRLGLQLGLWDHGRKLVSGDVLGEHSVSVELVVQRLDESPDQPARLYAHSEH